VALRDAGALTGLLARAAEMGLFGPDIESAKEAAKELNTKANALRDLAAATKVSAVAAAATLSC
jgi:hypothetical protein